VTRESDALDLEQGVFTWKDPRKIAQSLKNSADTSSRRKSPPFRSAMSMLVFYINRAGSKLDTDQKRILEQAKTRTRSASWSRPRMNCANFMGRGEELLCLK
jgi:hypothetical protein